MLFGYPANAIEKNWPHECLYEILNSIHHSLMTGETLPDWPESIPEAYRDKLKSRIGLKNKLSDYKIVLATLSIDEQNLILQALKEQNNISELLSCRQLDCKKIDDLPQTIHGPVKNLFEFAFNLLGELEIRDRHYHKIYKQITHHVCPFCGYEKFSSPEIGSKREELDHYLLKKSYPFAGANLYNPHSAGNRMSKYT